MGEDGSPGEPWEGELVLILGLLFEGPQGATWRVLGTLGVTPILDLSQGGSRPHCSGIPPSWLPGLQWECDILQGQERKDVRLPAPQWEVQGAPGPTGTKEPESSSSN